MDLNKKQIRHQIRHLRRSITAQDQAIAAKSLAQNLSSIRLFKQAKRIAFYDAFDGEISLANALTTALKAHKKCYYPALFPGRKPRLLFAPVDHHSHFNKNKYGINEPGQSQQNWIKPIELDLILLPLVGFDKNGLRLGMGGGYYDSSLAFLKQRQSWSRPRLIGVAHELQCLESIPGDPWDVPVEIIVTDKGIYQCS